MPLHLEVAVVLSRWGPFIPAGLGASGWAWWNSFIRSGEFSRFSLGSHSFSEFGQPENLTKYQSHPYRYLESKIFSTSYSSPPFTMSGPGCGSAWHSAILLGM